MEMLSNLSLVELHVKIWYAVAVLREEPYDRRCDVCSDISRNQWHVFQSVFDPSAKKCIDLNISI